MQCWRNRCSIRPLSANEIRADELKRAKQNSTFENRHEYPNMHLAASLKFECRFGYSCVDTDIQCSRDPLVIPRACVGMRGEVRRSH